MADYSNVSFKNNGKLKLLIIVGTRPEIIRLAAVINKTRKYFDVILAHTGQNYDYNLNGVFFHDLQLADPEVYMNAVGADLGETMGNIISESYKLMAAIQPDAVLVLGDTNSCLSVIGAKRLHIFPLLGVRFISVNDGYDSGMQIGNDVRGLEVAIKNIINASYSRDLSAKIAAADHVMQKKGMYLGGYRPFGFLPDPNDCHKLILDPVASRYVRLIFELALQGNRTGTIAKILNEKQIPTPAAYHVAESHVYSEQKAWDLQRSHWTSGTVYHVLKNEKYKGTYVGAKFIMPVPCKHRVLRAPLEQQVRIEDSHAAIVTPEEFEQAQMVIMLQHGKHQAGNYTKHQYPLKGKVYCGYCQKLMKYRVLKKLGPSFNCRFSATAVDSPCKRIPISEELLEHIVRNALTAQIKQAEYVLEILHERERKALICFSALERQEEKLSTEKAEIVKQRVALYEQYADGNMSKEEFIRQRDAYRAQEDERMEQIQRLRTEKDQAFQPVKKDTDNLQAVMNTVGEAGDVMHLSQNVVETFIDRIEVFNDESVKIRFTFEDAVKSYETE